MSRQPPQKRRRVDEGSGGRDGFGSDSEEGVVHIGTELDLAGLEMRKGSGVNEAMAASLGVEVGAAGKVAKRFIRAQLSNVGKKGNDQEVYDSEGRRRFHGAFTGGFSAGYYNTVGSEEGWKPSQFVSQRATAKASQPTSADSTSRAAPPPKARRNATQQLSDLMDDEDREDFGHKVTLAAGPGTRSGVLHGAAAAASGDGDDAGEMGDLDVALGASALESMALVKWLNDVNSVRFGERLLTQWESAHGKSAHPQPTGVREPIRVVGTEGLGADAARAPDLRALLTSDSNPVNASSARPVEFDPRSVQIGASDVARLTADGTASALGSHSPASHDTHGRMASLEIPPDFSSSFKHVFSQPRAPQRPRPGGPLQFALFTALAEGRSQRSRQAHAPGLDRDRDSDHHHQSSIPARDTRDRPIESDMTAHRDAPRAEATPQAAWVAPRQVVGSGLVPPPPLPSHITQVPHTATTGSWPAMAAAAPGLSSSSLGARFVPSVAPLPMPTIGPIPTHLLPIHPVMPPVARMTDIIPALTQSAPGGDRPSSAFIAPSNGPGGLRIRSPPRDPPSAGDPALAPGASHNPAGGSLSVAFAAAATTAAAAAGAFPAAATGEPRSERQLRNDAARRGMFGPLTRTVSPWVPAVAVSARFSLPPPSHATVSAGVKKQGGRSLAEARASGAPVRPGAAAMSDPVSTTYDSAQIAANSRAKYQQYITQVATGATKQDEHRAGPTDAALAATAAAAAAALAAAAGGGGLPMRPPASPAKGEAPAQDTEQGRRTRWGNAQSQAQAARGQGGGLTEGPGAAGLEAAASRAQDLDRQAEALLLEALGGAPVPDPPAALAPVGSAAGIPSTLSTKDNSRAVAAPTPTRGETDRHLRSRDAGSRGGPGGRASAESNFLLSLAAQFEDVSSTKKGVKSEPKSAKGAGRQNDTIELD